MARRSIVVNEPQAKPRRAVVVRAGPPQRDRRTWFDVGAGVIGAILLILTLSLFFLLPQDEPPLPQFEVNFESTLIEDGTVHEHVFAAGESFDFAFPYDEANLYDVAVAFEWTDDIAASLPDRFQVELLDPEGTVVSGPTEYLNPQPDSDGAPVSPTYSARPVRQAVRYELEPRPSTQVVTAISHDETVEDAQARIEADTARGGTGTWTLRVTLLEAGGCPDPTTFDLNRATACNTEAGFDPTAPGVPGDAGNPFQVTLVTFTKYDPVVEVL